MLHPTHLAEAALYTDDLARAERFFTTLLGAEVAHRDPRLCAVRIAQDQVLLLFQRGASLQPTTVNHGIVPPHNGSGPLHLCLGIRAEDLSAWEDRLAALGIPVESRVHWPGGATSLYLRDPDGQAIELATPGLWRQPTANAPLEAVEGANPRRGESILDLIPNPLIVRRHPPSA